MTMNTHSGRSVSRLATVFGITALVIAFSARPLSGDGDSEGGGAQGNDRHITIESVQQIGFGLLRRGSEVYVEPMADGAAQFVITGKSGKKFTLTVGNENLAHDNDSVLVEAAIIPLAITGYDCAYSLDHGTTWTPFSSNLLTEELTFPKKQGSPDTQVLVRVGARVTVSEGQQRGSYLGTIALSAEYGWQTAGGGDSDTDGDSNSESDTDSNGGSDDGSGGSDSDGGTDTDGDTDAINRGRAKLPDSIDDDFSIYD